MPTAVASFDDNFDFDEPARKKAPRKPRAAASKGRGPTRGKKGKKQRLPAINMQKVVRYGAIGMSGVLAMAIMVNALVLQKGHHPAPLFGKAIALGPSPTPMAKPTQVARALPEADTPVTPQPVPAPASRHAVEPAGTGGSDAIGALIDGKALPAAAPAPKVDSKTVAGAQRALVKLGFVLKPSGTVGPQTRKAIETFERDRHMPVNGELTHRLVKVLAAESGLKID